MNKNIQSSLQWRYATKLFDSDKKLSDSEIDSLLEATRLAPSSLGLQPWKGYIITNKEVRAKLKAAAWNQSQVSDASHLIVFASRKDMSETYINAYLKNIASVRSQKIEDLEGFKKMIMGSTAGRTPEQIKEWNARQTYIALGFLLETAALMNIDACPMEGFDTKQFDTILGIDKSEYASVVMVAVGHRSEEDKYARATKVRLCREELFIRV